MLEVTNLDCVRGDRTLFKGLNFLVNEGEAIELRGPNGSGKTSLLRILCGLATPAQGEVRWNGTNIRHQREEYSNSISYMAHLNGLKDEFTTMENLLVAERVAGNALTTEQGVDTLERVGLKNQRNLAARFLSAGQRRRLALARLLASRARLWILDEVLTSLDDAGAGLARELIETHLTAGGMAVIATHHDLNLSVDSVRRIDVSVGTNPNQDRTAA
jgi:heme exporter protein A